MIRPTKFLDPSIGVLRVAATMLEILGDVGPVRLDELLNRSVRNLPARASVNTRSALDLIFLLGLVDYDPDSDSVFMDERVR